MDSSVSLKDQIWFLRVCHHVSNELYHRYRHRHRHRFCRRVYARPSGWYSTVRETLLIFSYGMNWITVTKTVHINNICILCNWICKWPRERNGRGEMRRRTELRGTLHCRFYRPRLCESIAVLFWTSGAGTVTVMEVIRVFWTRSSSWVMQYTLARQIPTHPTFPTFLKYLPSVEIRKLDYL